MFGGKRREVAEGAFMNSRSCFPDNPVPWVGHALAVVGDLRNSEGWGLAADWLAHADKVSLGYTV